MPCKIKIKENLIEEIKVKTNKVLNKTLNDALDLGRIINASYKSKVVSFKEDVDGIIDRTIFIPDDLVNVYYDNELRIEQEEIKNTKTDKGGQTNIFYQKGNPRENFNERLRTSLLSFIKGLNINVEENADDVLKQLNLKTGDAISAFDILQKYLALGKNVTNKDLTLQTANIIYSFIGKKSILGVQIWKSIDNWSKYDSLYNKFDKLYKATLEDEEFQEYGEFTETEKKNFNPFAHKQAIIHLISEMLTYGIDNNYIGEKRVNPDITKDYFAEIGHKEKYVDNKLVEIFNKVFNWIQEYVFKNVAVRTLQEEELKNLMLDIVDDVYKQDFKKFIRVFYEQDGKIVNKKGEEYERKYYNKTLESDLFAKRIIDRLFNNPYIKFKLSGSQVLRKYGRLLRPLLEDLHDIDGVITLAQFMKERTALAFKQWAQSRGLELMAKKKSKQFIKEITPLLEQQIWYRNVKNEFPSWRLTNAFIGRDHKKGESITITGIIDHPTEIDPATGEKKGYVIDFFLRIEEGNYPEIFDMYWKDWKQIFEAKLNMGRAKDLNDLIYFIPNLEDKYKFTNRGFRYFTFSNDVISEESETQEQKPEMEASPAAPETISKVKKVIAQMGVNIESMVDYLKHSSIKLSGANALADLTAGIIAVVEGKENVALTEEMVHVATAMINEVEPSLITNMISKIGRFKIYQKVLDTYKGDPDYQLPNGKPDIRKLKKEAVDKLIAELIIKRSEGSTEFPELLEEENRSMITKWWDWIVDRFKGYYSKASIDIFEKVSDKIISGDIGAMYAKNIEGAVRLFYDNPELASIGSEEQYMIYLNTIFSKSKIRNIVYHGTGAFDKITELKTFQDKIYFTDEYTAASYANWDAFNRGEHDPEVKTGFQVIPAMINLENPVYLNNVNFKETEVNKEGDGIIGTNIIDPLNGTETQYIVRNSEQVHILGSEKDINNFREFMKTAPKVFKGEGIFKQLSQPQIDFQARVEHTRNNVESRPAEKGIEIDPFLLDTEEASNNYWIKQEDGTWKINLKRVTDRVEQWYRKKFPGKIFTEEEKAFNNIKRTIGIRGHNFLEKIHSRYFNKDGTRRPYVARRKEILTPRDEEMYEQLEAYYVDLIDKLSEKGKEILVFSELIIYDPELKEGGTVDLFIMDENGKGHIIDWKFMNISKNSHDIPWFKQGAFGIQLSRYTEMLTKNYGVKSWGMKRAVPFLMKFKKKNPLDLNSELILDGFVTGTVDTNKIVDMKLMPVSEETESTGDVLLDKMLVELNKVYREVGSHTVKTDEQKEYKRERLNILKESIRAAQGAMDISPLIDVIKVMRVEGEQIIEDWNTIYDKTNPSSTDMNNSDLSDYADNIREYLPIAQIFGKMNDLIGDLIYNEEMKKGAKTAAAKADLAFRKEVLASIQLETKKIRESEAQVKIIGGEFANKFIGQRNSVTGFLNPEPIWKGISALFRGASESPLASINILFKLVTNAKGRAEKSALSEVNELMSIREKLSKRGGDLRNIVEPIYNKDDKGNFTNKLIFKHQREFYAAVDNNALDENQSMQWIADNINIKEYLAEATEMLKKKIDYYKRIYSDDEDLLEDLIQEEINKWDFTKKGFTGWNNFILKRHPKDKWLSEKYLALKEDKDLFELYEFITKINKKAADIGYIQNKVHSTFLPFVRKGFAESLAWDFGFKAITNLAEHLSVRADDIGFGAINELTSELEHSIPKYFTYDFTLTKSGERDYSQLSEELFKNMITYINHMEKYNYLSEIEGQVKLIKTIETFKGHLSTSATGNVLEEGSDSVTILGGNEENSKTFDNFMRALFYEQKYPLTSSDLPLGAGKLMNKIKKFINKVAGKEIYSPDETPTATSLVKTMDAANRAYSQKTLGFEVISGAVNLFGAGIQIATQAGNYFKAREFAKNVTALLGDRYRKSSEREMFIQLRDIFMPLKEDITYTQLRKAGMSKVTRVNWTDKLMMFMREPELHVENTVFLTLLDNMMVQDGKIISIREFVKNKYKNKNKYNSPAEYREIKRLIEQEIKELKETRSLTNTKKLENGHVIIPGLDLNNFDETIRLTKLTRLISRNATGGMSDSDLNQMGMNIFTRSMMVFKMWIPKLVDTRFSEFRKVADDFSVIIDENGMTTGEKYDIGRVRLFWNFMHLNIARTVKQINDILTVNENGLVLLDELYIKYSEDYRKRTGEIMTLTKEEFTDLMLTNLRNQVKELSLLLSMVGAVFAVGYFSPPDESDKASKNFHRFVLKAVDRFVQELSFFYNPIEFQRMLGGSAFPALGLFKDIERFFSNTAMELTGIDITNLELTSEEVKKKAYPVKYLAKMLPVSKAAITWGAILDSDFAEEFDITIQKNNNR